MIAVAAMTASGVFNLYFLFISIDFSFIVCDRSIILHCESKLAKKRASASEIL